MAVCSGGAALRHVGQGAATFQELTSVLPSGLLYLVPVIAGNDIYNKSGWTIEVGEAVVRFAGLANSKSERVLVVGGMSAATWRYDGVFADRYDVGCAELARSFERAGVSFTSGVA